MNFLSSLLSIILIGFFIKYLDYVFPPTHLPSILTISGFLFIFSHYLFFIRSSLVLLNLFFLLSLNLFFLILFQYSINFETLILNDISSIGKAVSFSGFISVPIILFLLHSLRNTIELLDRFSYSSVLLTWILSSQLFI